MKTLNAARGRRRPFRGELDISLVMPTFATLNLQPSIKPGRHTSCLARSSPGPSFSSPYMPHECKIEREQSRKCDRHNHQHGERIVETRRSRQIAGCVSPVRPAGQEPCRRRGSEQRDSQANE
jgi:hypothetical protein